MNQLTKTLCFVAAAAAAVILAYMGRPVAGHRDAEAAMAAAPLTPDFKEPLDAKRLKIVRFDEGLASLSQIEVKETGGIWTLPSHDDYPADAENRIRDATTPFIALESLSVVSDNQGDHSLYGVLEPGAGKTTVGDQGVGTLVTVEGDGGKKLVNLIIGKPVKDAPELRYVRQPGRSRVYVAKVDPENLPVRFEDWIEKDLLELNSWDIHQLELKDYSFNVAATLSGPMTDYDQRLEMTVTDDNGKWKLDELLVAQNDQLQPTELQEDEELNSEKLNELKNALDGLEIVNVERKPAQLGADLRAEESLFNDRAGLQSLFERGFYPVQLPPDGHVEMLSADGEVLVRTKDGVEYILRFGGVEGVDTESGEGKLNRFLLVTARVNEAHFPQPELQPLPETVEDLEKLEAAQASDPSAAATEADTDAQPSGEDTEIDVPASDAPQNAEEAEAAAAGEPAADGSTDDAPEEEAPADEPQEAAPEGDQASSFAPGRDNPTRTRLTALQQDDSRQTSGETSADVAAVEDESTAEDDVAQADEESTDTPNETPAATNGTASGEETDGDAVQDPEARLQQERERITKENQRKIDERNDKLSKARQKVQELNYRFADWYYVISEDVYKKIHLSHTDIIRKAEAEDDEASESDSGDVPTFNLPGLQGGLPGLGADDEQ
jgi:hypothetical protein